MSEGRCAAFFFTNRNEDTVLFVEVVISSHHPGSNAEVSSQAHLQSIENKMSEVIPSLCIRKNRLIVPHKIRRHS